MNKKTKEEKLKQEIEKFESDNFIDWQMGIGQRSEEMIKSFLITQGKTIFADEVLKIINDWAFSKKKNFSGVDKDFFINDVNDLRDEISKLINSHAKKEVKTLSNLTSGVTKQGGVNAQDDTKLQLERSASLPVDNQRDNQTKSGAKYS